MKTTVIAGFVIFLMSAFTFHTDSNEALFKSVETKVYEAKNEKKRGALKKVIKEKYNEKGLIISATTYNPDNSVKGKKTYEYDQFGNKVKMMVYAGEARLRYWYEFKYNKQNHRIEWLHYGGTSQSLRRKYTYLVDEDGNDLEEVYFDEGLSPARNTTKFFYENGQKVKKELYDSQGQLETYTEFKEDSKGNLLSKNTYYANGSKKSGKKYAYEDLDKHGNWQIKKYWKSGRISTVSERVISYH